MGRHRRPPRGRARSERHRRQAALHGRVTARVLIFTHARRLDPQPPFAFFGEEIAFRIKSFGTFAVLKIGRAANKWD